MTLRTALALALCTAAAAAACGGGSSATSQGLRGLVRRGPIAPVCRTGVPCSKPAAKAILLFTRRGHTTVRVHTDRRGRYTARLAAGRYRVVIPRREGVAIMPGTAVVRADVMRRVDFAIDTGIR